MNFVIQKDFIIPIDGNYIFFVYMLVLQIQFTYANACFFFLIKQYYLCLPARMPEKSRREHTLSVRNQTCKPYGNHYIA